MVTKEQVKKEIDNVPDGFLDGIFAFVIRFTRAPKRISWKEWRANLDKFTPDFMQNRNQLPNQLRDSFE